MPRPSRKCKRGAVCGGDSIIHCCAIDSSESCAAAYQPPPGMAQRMNYNWKCLSGGIKLHALYGLRKWVRVKGRGGGFNAFQVALKKPYHLFLSSSSQRRRFGGKLQLMTTTTTTANGSSFNRTICCLCFMLIPYWTAVSLSCNPISI